MKYMLGCHCHCHYYFAAVMKCISLKNMWLSWPLKIFIHGFVHFSWFMNKITSEEFRGNVMTHVNTTKSEIFAFMAMKSGFMRFSTHFHGIFMKKRFIVVWQKGLKKNNLQTTSFSLSYSGDYLHSSLVWDVFSRITTHYYYVGLI